MIFLPIYIAAHASAVASRVAAAQEAERRRLGLPPPPPRTPEEVARLEKLSREGDFLMIAWIIFGAIVFTSFWGSLIYMVVKIAFASKGIKFP